MDHQQLKDLLPLAALDRLEPEETRALEAHLRAGCDECEAELREFREAAASLAFGLDPAGSDQRIWQHLDALLSSSGERTSTPAAMRRLNGSVRPGRARARIWQAATGALAAALAAVAIYAGWATIQLDRRDAERQQLTEALGAQIQNLSSQLASAQGQVDTLKKVLAGRLQLEHILTAPDLRLTRLESLQPAPGASAFVVASIANNMAMIQASGLPPTPAGKTYELWWITKERGPVKAGLFRVEDGRPVVAPATTPPAGEHVLLSAVTLEPAGGVSKPTGAMYLKGTPG